MSKLSVEFAPAPVNICWIYRVPQKLLAMDVNNLQKFKLCTTRFHFSTSLDLSDPLILPENGERMKCKND
jgi:hypothetical protein